jgi:hypothetical protein
MSTYSYLKKLYNVYINQDMRLYVDIFIFKEVI